MTLISYSLDEKAAMGSPEWKEIMTRAIQGLTLASDRERECLRAAMYECCRLGRALLVSELVKLWGAQCPALIVADVHNLSITVSDEVLGQLMGSQRVTAQDRQVLVDKLYKLDPDYDHWHRINERSYKQWMSNMRSKGEGLMSRVPLADLSIVFPELGGQSKTCGRPRMLAVATSKMLTKVFPLAVGDNMPTMLLLSKWNSIVDTVAAVSGAVFGEILAAKGRLESELVNSEGEKKELRAKNDSLWRRAACMEDELIGLEAKVRENDSNEDSHRAEVNGLIFEVQDLEQKVKELRAVVADLRRGAESQDAYITELEYKVLDNRDDTIQNSAWVDSLDADLQYLVLGAEAKTKEIEELKARNAQLERTTTEALEEMRKSNMEVASLTCDLGAERAAHENLKKHWEQLFEVHEVAMERLNSLECRILEKGHQGRGN